MATGLVATVLTVVTGGTEPGAKGEIKTKSILADRMPRMAPYAVDFHPEVSRFFHPEVSHL